MSIIVVGSIAFDSIKTPYGQRKYSLGGAANYFAMAAHFFSGVKMLGVVGEDFPSAHLDFLAKKQVDTSGIQVKAGRSFHWQGEYGWDMNVATTISTELNVFEYFLPEVPVSYRNAETIFLANIDPELQIHVLKQMNSPKIRALDSMNFWINGKLSKLKQAISMVDILFANDAEIRALAGEHNLLKAIKAAHKMGANTVVIKRGEYGSLLSRGQDMAFLPAFPVENVFDPTGAGDTFAGGFLGYLDQKRDINLSTLKRAMLLGTVMSSFTIEGFSFDRLLGLTSEDILRRANELWAMATIEGMDGEFLSLYNQELAFKL
jgi:sugar/nucleoside kinase (ribokinase family)